ncbi:hypothetical protein DMN91_008859 [Ooceraea biroi]|uniref:Uncharacterized protein n=1 Tax=Ooceraea biroi TaxID=2015173 RepID=A0A026W1I1_OOCBI|nr:uncharacterized protein LOC113562610 [Ooceraea biroi]EZA49441.1 hypothetical protein X777_11939 [Ooceraea biroi]RLU18502.1 hypothetical protein DMN91_008859 [Ooceraea biroi]
MTCLSVSYLLIFLLADVNAAGIGEAWQVTPHTKPMYAEHSSRPRLNSSAFEVRTVSGVGRLTSLNEAEKHPAATESTPSDSVSTTMSVPEDASRKDRDLEYLRRFFENSSYDDDEVEDDVGDDAPPVQTLQKMLKKTIMMRLLRAFKDEEDDAVNDDEEAPVETTAPAQRFRRQAENETSMEKISTTKSVREARLNSPETWSTSVQPISVEFRHRIPLDQVVQQQQQEEEEAAAAAALANSYRRYPQAPRADFVTGHHHHRRGYPEYRESRDMPLTGRNYDDYEQMSWYRNAVRDRDYDPLSYPSYRRGYSYPHPDRYRMERDYYVRPASDHYYYDRYDRYRDDELDFHGRQRSMPKPRRVIYYATLPEIVRKPVDLRNYPRGSAYDSGAIKSQATRDDAYKRVPGNVDPGKYRYRNAYNSYDPYAKRSSYYDRGYGYSEGELRRVRLSTKESLKNGDGFGVGSNEQRRVSNLVAIRDDRDKLPWPVQIGTEVSIKDDERITGRKVFGESAGGYERYQNAQLQKAPDATGSSELQSDN